MHMQKTLWLSLLNLAASNVRTRVREARRLTPTKKDFLRLAEIILSILTQEEEKMRGQFAVVKKVSKPEQVKMKQKNA